MDRRMILRSLLSGILGLIFGIVAVFIVHFVGIPFNEFSQALIAVGISSFFGAFFGRFFAEIKK